MKSDELTPTVFLRGMRTSEFTCSVPGYKLDDGSAVIPIWTRDDLAETWCSLHADSTERFEVDARLAVGMLLSSGATYLVVDPRTEDKIWDHSFTIASVSTDRLLCLTSFSDTWDAVSHFMLSQGFPPDAMDAFRVFAAWHPELTALAMINAFTMDIAARTQELEEEQKPHTASRERADVPEEICSAIKQFPPPHECPACGEDRWEFVSISPNVKAATWVCEYCGQKAVVKRHRE